VDIEGTFAFVDAVNRAFFNTCLVLDVHTRLRDYVGHVPCLSTVVPEIPGSTTGPVAGTSNSEPIIPQRELSNLAGRLTMNW
jgi:hypothetical protein